jgi:dTDP-glucose 4,6-dehydratase
MRIVVVGGAGFIGSAVSRYLLAHRGAHVLVVDKLTHTSSLASLAAVAQSPRYSFRKADIRDRERIAGLIQAFAPDAIIHADIEKAADRLIGAAGVGVEASLVGTSNLVDAASSYFAGLPPARREHFRFLSIAGRHAGPDGSVAAALVGRILAAAHTNCGLPTLVSQADATYGPYQHAGEPVADAIIAAIDGLNAASVEPLPARLLHLDDHAHAVAQLLDHGVPGENYGVPGQAAAGGIDLRERIAALVERHSPRSGSPRARLQAAITTLGRTSSAAPLPQTCSLLPIPSGWRPEHSLDSGLSQAIRWYLDNQFWWRPMQAAQGAGNPYGILRSA